MPVQMVRSKICKYRVVRRKLLDPSSHKARDLDHDEGILDSSFEDFSDRLRERDLKIP